MIWSHPSRSIRLLLYNVDCCVCVVVSVIVEFDRSANIFDTFIVDRFDTFIVDWSANSIDLIAVARCRLLLHQLGILVLIKASIDPIAVARCWLLFVVVPTWYSTHYCWLLRCRLLLLLYQSRSVMLLLLLLCCQKIVVIVIIICWRCSCWCIRRRNWDGW